MAGFKSERVAGFNLECMAGFIGIRNLDSVITIAWNVHPGLKARPLCAVR
jgi:hypothetical protein